LAQGAIRYIHRSTPLRAFWLPHSGETTAIEARGPRVLVIDDDDDLRTLVVRVVKQAGYAVDSASDGQAALDRLAERTYDVIVCDLRMPGMDGVTFYREVERRNPVMARRVVLMTAHVRSDEYMEFLRGVHAPVLNKPFTLDEFRSTLARMVGPRR
jgi:CheY-like chemotaxis protein